MWDGRKLPVQFLKDLFLDHSFLHFINDLPNKVKNPCKLYADDSKFDSAREYMRYKETLKGYGLDQKYKVMGFGRKNTEHEYTMESNEGQWPHVMQKTLVERD